MAHASLQASTSGAAHHTLRSTLQYGPRVIRGWRSIPKAASQPGPRPDRDATSDILSAGVDLAKTMLASDPRWKMVGSVAEKLIEPGPSDRPSSSNRSRHATSSTDDTDGAEFSGMYALAAATVAVHVLKLDLATAWIRNLLLNHVAPQWWQYATSALCTASWAQLSTVLFYLYVFGRVIERRCGWAGVWSAFLLSGAGAAAARLLWLPHKVGKLALMTPGAVGAAFGVFVASTLLRPSLSWRRTMEVLLVGQFVTRVALADGGAGLGGLASVPLASVLGQRLPPQWLELGGAAAGAAVFCVCVAVWEWVADLLEGAGDTEGGGSRRPGKKGRRRS